MNKEDYNSKRVLHAQLRIYAMCCRLDELLNENKSRPIMICRGNIVEGLPTRPTIQECKEVIEIKRIAIEPIEEYIRVLETDNTKWYNKDYKNKRRKYRNNR